MKSHALSRFSHVMGSDVDEVYLMKLEVVQ